MSIGSMIEINHPKDPRIGVFLNQKDAWLKASHNPDRTSPQVSCPDQPTNLAPDYGRFIAEGVLVVEHLISSRFPIESVFVSRSRIQGVEQLLETVPEGVPIYVAQQDLMDEVVGYPIHRGLLACGKRLPNPDPEALARSCRALIVLEDLSNHDNVGSVFRSCAALGGEGVGILLSQRCCDPLYRKSLRVSMGHALRVPFACVEDLGGLMDRLHEIGFESIALTPDPSAMALSRDLEPKIDRPVLCFGAEGTGLSAGLQSRVSKRIRIPMASGVDSLNIAVAAAVSMHMYLEPSG